MVCFIYMKYPVLIKVSIIIILCENIEKSVKMEYTIQTK